MSAAKEVDVEQALRIAATTAAWPTTPGPPGTSDGAHRGRHGGDPSGGHRSPAEPAKAAPRPGHGPGADRAAGPGRIAGALGFGCRASTSWWWRACRPRAPGRPLGPASTWVAGPARGGARHRRAAGPAAGKPCQARRRLRPRGRAAQDCHARLARRAGRADDPRQRPGALADGGPRRHRRQPAQEGGRPQHIDRVGDRRRGSWLADPGAPHEIFIARPDGDVDMVTSALAGDTLVFARDGTLYRLESALGRDATIAIAESLRCGDAPYAHPGHKSEVTRWQAPERARTRGSWSRPTGVGSTRCGATRPRTPGAPVPGRGHPAALRPAGDRRSPRLAQGPGRLGPAGRGGRAEAGRRRDRRGLGTLGHNPVGGWYGLKKGLRGRFGVYLPPLLEELGLAELEHNPKNNRMRAR